MAKKKATTPKLSDAEFEQLANFSPAIDDTTMYEMEAVAGSNDLGVKRRISLAVLTRSAEDLAKVSLKDQGTYAAMRRAVEDFETHAKAMYEASTAAAMRLVIADVGYPMAKQAATVSPA